MVLEDLRKLDDEIKKDRKKFRCIKD